jgi:hypothetical protein
VDLDAMRQAAIGALRSDASRSARTARSRSIARAPVVLDAEWQYHSD